jgi:hypothetical protein
VILKSNLGIPTVHLNADFIAPGRVGDELSLTLAVTRFESSSLTVEVVFSGPAGDVRVRSEAALGLTDARYFNPISDNLRDKKNIEFLGAMPYYPRTERRRRSAAPGIKARDEHSREPISTHAGTSSEELLASASLPCKCMFARDDLYSSNPFT